ncbi:hypothetical protein LIER_04026 [Lithospermum erythrorhizon]|uniref:Uncharacterized protein n=1 Tax=Lithospermum erythrorhizon TaxID=34254 RepID=A0AAV3NV78_LITER
MEVAEREGSRSGGRTSMEIRSENSGEIRSSQFDDDNEEEDNPKKKKRKKISSTHCSTIIKGSGSYFRCKLILIAFVFVLFEDDFIDDKYGDLDS